MVTGYLLRLSEIYTSGNVSLILSGLIKKVFKFHCLFKAVSSIVYLGSILGDAIFRNLVTNYTTLCGLVRIFSALPVFWDPLQSSQVRLSA